MTFEEVAGLLWQDRGGRGLDGSRSSGRCPLVEVSDRMRWALVMCGASDPCGPTCARPPSPVPPAG